MRASKSWDPCNNTKWWGFPYSFLTAYLTIFDERRLSHWKTRFLKPLLLRVTSEFPKILSLYLPNANTIFPQPICSFQNYRFWTPVQNYTTRYTVSSLISSVVLVVRIEKQGPKMAAQNGNGRMYSHSFPWVDLSSYFICMASPSHPAFPD